jgi:hypothetical protein
MDKIQGLGKIILCKRHAVHHKSNMDYPDNETSLLDFAKIMYLVSELKHENSGTEFLHIELLLPTEFFSLLLTAYY